MKRIVLIVAAAVAAVSCVSSKPELSNDEYDRQYMARKEFAICDANNDGEVSEADLPLIKNMGSKYKLQKFLKSRGGEAIATEQYVAEYQVPENTIDGERIGNIAYKQIGDERVMMDLYLPREEYRGEGKMPVVVFFHGGGWRNGDKYIITGGACQPIVDSLLKRGVAVAAANYRFIIDGKQFVPTVVSDAKDAVAFLHRDGKKFGLDGERIIVWGGSAGGHLSLMCGFTDVDSFEGDAKLAKWRVKPTGVVSWYGSGDFTLGTWEDAVARGHETFYRCFTDSKDADELHAKGLESSPLEHITSDDPLTILFGGDADTTVSINDAKKMYAKLQECGVESEIIVVHGAGHGWSGKNFTPNKLEINQLTCEAVYKILGL